MTALPHHPSEVTATVCNLFYVVLPVALYPQVKNAFTKQNTLL